MPSFRGNSPLGDWINRVVHYGASGVALLALLTLGCFITTAYCTKVTNSYGT